LVEKYYPTLKAELSQQGSPLPRYVEKEFEAYLQCGCAEHGLFRIRCDGCHLEHLLAPNLQSKRAKLCEIEWLGRQEGLLSNSGGGEK